MVEVAIDLMAGCLTITETIERVIKSIRRNIQTNAAAKKKSQSLCSEN
jgi:hypothetical protein